MSKVNLATISSRYGSIDALNANFEAIELALDNVLFLDGTAPNALEADIDMDGNRILNLPNPTTAGEPINLAWATANYSQFQVVAGLAEEIASLGGLTVELEALYAIDGDITIVANIANDVTTVSGINASVSAVASNATNINTVATNLTTTNTIGTVAGSIGNVNNVGTAITSVNTVGGHIANVDTVATIYSDVQAVALIDSNVTTVAGDSANITTLAGISADIQTLADIEDGTSATDAIQTVAGISGNVTTVAGISSSVTAVANISGDIQAVENKLLEVSTVADDLLEAVSEIETVAAHVTNIDLVGTNITNVNTVAGIDSQVTAVASNATNVNAVGTDLLGSNTIGTVTSNIVAVNTVATNISDVTNFADVYYGSSATAPTTRQDSSALVAGDIYFNTVENSVYFYDGATWVLSTVNTNTTVYNYILYSFYNSTGTLTNNAGALVDTSGGAFTLNLPATPTAGDKVFVVDVSNSFGTNNLTIAQNGSTIEGVAEDFIIDISNVAVEFVYTGTTWKSYAKVGAYSGNVVTESAVQTLTNKTLSAPIVTDYTESTVAIGTVSTTHTFSLASGTLQTATLTASTACTFTMPTATTGKSFMLILTQASGGNGTATFTGVKWTGGNAPTITATANAIDMVSFISDGTYWYGSIVQDMQ